MAYENWSRITTLTRRRRRRSAFIIKNKHKKKIADILVYPSRVVCASLSLSAKISTNYLFFLSICSPSSHFHSLFAKVPSRSLSFFQSSFFSFCWRKKIACLFVLCLCFCNLFLSFWCCVTSGVIMVKCRHLAKAFGWLWHRFLCKKHISHTNGNSSLCTFVSQPRLAT